MKKIFFAAVMLIMSCRLFAQAPKAASTLPPPLAVREVSGVVKDETGQTVVGATILLTSKVDTIRAATNIDGIFVLHNVKQATFVVTVQSLGLMPHTQRYLMNDLAKRIVLDPIVLKSQTLKEVTINGTPSIIYKIDTVQYKASDYKVRENATLDELLRHMEGMEVGSDGSLTHQGQAITKARLNGKDYAGGDVAQAIQNLPADIVDNVQIVNDYGDQAARTGIKDGDPTKVLNITTLANKSIGNIARITASGGNDDRYNERLFLQRINANQQISIIANLTNSVNGVASTGNVGGTATVGGGGGGNGGGNGGGGGGSTAVSNSNGGTGGTTTSGGPSFNYRDQLSKTTQINGSYRYTLNDVFAINNSNGATFSKAGTTIDTISSTGHSKNHTQAVTFDYEFQPDSQNYVRIEPTFSYNSAPTDKTETDIYRGLQNEDVNSHTTTTSTSPNYGVTATYQHLFKSDRRRNISISYILSNSNSNQSTNLNEHILYRGPTNTPVLDSLVQRQTTNSQINKSDRVTLQYVEPLSKIGAKTTQLLEFTEAYIYRGYNTNQTTSNQNAAGRLSVIDSLSNIYNYSFTQGNFAADYRINTSKIQLSLGARAITTQLNGDNIAKNTSTRRNDFYFIPLMRFQYQWSSTEQLSVNYQGTPTEPSFSQLQPIPNVANPQFPIYGNPDLKPSFGHIITTRFNDYIANSKFNFSLNSRTTFYQDQIVANTVVVQQPITRGGVTSQDVIYQTHYLNANGAVNELITYNVAKQLNDRAYNLELNGTINYGHSLTYQDNSPYHQTSWEVNERFGPRLNPNTSIEINPYISYDDSRDFSTVPLTAAAIAQGIKSSSDIKTTAMNLEGKFYLLKDRTFTFEYNFTKSYISGIPDYNKNPFVVNAYLEKEFFARKNGILRISAFDIFDQNVFVNHQVTTTGYTNTQSNTLSRYVLVSFILNLQKFSGSPTRNGQPMRRRGDGSFIVD